MITLRPAYVPAAKPANLSVNYTFVANVSPDLTHPSAGCTIDTSTIIASESKGSSTLTVEKALTHFRGDYPAAEVKFGALWLATAQDMTLRMDGGKRGGARDRWPMTLAETDIKIWNTAANGQIYMQWTAELVSKKEKASGEPTRETINLIWWICFFNNVPVPATGFPFWIEPLTKLLWTGCKKPVAMLEVSMIVNRSKYAMHDPATSCRLGCPSGFVPNMLRVP